jgi:hypothetical protein
MKNILFILLGLITSTAHAQFEIGASVSNNGTYQAEMNIMDSTIYSNKKTVFTLQKGISFMTYSINDKPNYYYYQNAIGDIPNGNNFYMGTLIRIGAGKKSVVTSDVGFGIGLAKQYSTEYEYDPINGFETLKYTYQGFETAIGMTWGIDVKIMKNVNTYFKAGGLFKDYGDFAAVGFKYIIPNKNK